MHSSSARACRPRTKLRFYMAWLSPGSMREVLERARWIEGLDPRYAPFARELSSFAQAYQSQALLRFVTRFQQTG